MSMPGWVLGWPWVGPLGPQRAEQPGSSQKLTPTSPSTAFAGAVDTEGRVRHLWPAHVPCLFSWLTAGLGQLPGAESETRGLSFRATQPTACLLPAAL